MNLRRTLSVLALLTPALAAQGYPTMIPHADRKWTPKTVEPRRILAVDLDNDVRDDAVFVLPNGTMQRAANPGILPGLFPFTTRTGVVDAAELRLAGQADVVASIDAGGALRTDWVGANGDTVSEPGPVWSGVSRLRSFSGWRFPLVAGIHSNGTSVKLAALDVATRRLNALPYTLNFASPLLDLEFALETDAVFPQCVGVTASSIQRWGITDTSPTTSTPIVATEASLVRLPNHADVAVMYRNGSGTAATLLLLEPTSTPIFNATLWGYEDTQLETMKLRSLDVGDLNHDGLFDLVYGQTNDNRSIVQFQGADPMPLFTVANCAIVSPCDTTPSVTSTQPGPVVGLADGTGQPGLLYHSADGNQLRVFYEVLPPLEAFGDGSDPFPQVDLDYLPYLREVGASVLGVQLLIPEVLADYVVQSGFSKAQITVIPVENIVDQNGLPTLSTATLAGIANDVYWDLPDLQTVGSNSDRTYEFPIQLSPSLLSDIQTEHTHLLLLLRFVTVQGGGSPTVVAASFTTPFLFAEDWGSQDPRETYSHVIEGEGEAGALFLPGDVSYSVVEYDQTAGSPHHTPNARKNIGRLRRMPPVPPPTENPPGPVTVTSQGNANSTAQ